MKDWQLPLDALPGEIVDQDQDIRNTVSAPEASSHRRRPSPATWSQPSYLKPTAASSPCQLPGPAIAGECDCLLSQDLCQPTFRGKTASSARLQREDSLLSLPSEGRQPAQPALAARTSASPAKTSEGSHPQGASLRQPASQPLLWRPLCCPALPATSPRPATVEVFLTVKRQFNPDVLSCIFRPWLMSPHFSNIIFS